MILVAVSEGGYGFMLDGCSALTPYAAFAGQSFHAPDYSEIAASGSFTFALSHEANSTDVSHTEVGAHYGRSFAWEDNGTLLLDATAAWEHELGDNPIVEATFQALPNSEFIVQGAKPAVDTALIGVGLHVQNENEISFGVHGDARISAGTTIITGAADVSLNW